jgi:hypothetical protein
VIHNYRWRLGLAEGEVKYGAFEKQLAAFPSIAVPTITLESDANGAPHPDPPHYRRHRPQPATGSPAGIRASRCRRRSRLTGVHRRKVVR